MDERLREDSERCVEQGAEDDLCGAYEERSVRLTWPTDRTKVPRTASKSATVTLGPACSCRSRAESITMKTARMI